MENTVKLVQPITIDGKAVTELQFRRPKGRDLRRMDAAKGEINKVMVMIPVLCTNGITPDQVDEMDGADVMACQNVIARFLGL